ncbi:MAG: dUTP diphosphatase [Desulfobulbus sp.]|nr:dUTP diphosphatase [Desulfobulbus sp.]
MQSIRVAVTWVDPEASIDLALPAYETELAAGMDVCAALTTPLILESGDIALIPSGLAVAIPQGFEIQVRPRSGLAIKHGITVINAPGTIDADYRGEIKVGLINLGKNSYAINRGDRIAQLVLAPVARADWQVVKALDATERGSGGFGHTGVTTVTSQLS